MKDRHNVRRTIPDVLNAIRDAKDIEEVSYYENIMVSMFASRLLLLATIATFALDYFMRMNTLRASLINGLTYLFLSVAFGLVTRIKLKTYTATLLVSILSGFTLIFTTFRFYDDIGMAIWYVAFILILLSMIRVSRTMLYTIAAAMLISGAYIVFKFPQVPDVQMSQVYHITQQAILMPAICVVAVVVHKISNDRYLSAQKHYMIALSERDEIMALNEEITASQREIEHLAYHDNLTGLPNRMLFTDHINRAISDSDKSGKPFALMYLDLDDFKSINDNMGHAMGDQLLASLSQRLTLTLKKGDIASRIGGDEFNIMIENLESICEAEMVAERILRTFDNPFVLNGRDCFVTASIGVVIYPADGNNADILIKNADIAMYEAKRNGKNQYVICDYEMKAIADETLKLSAGLYQALERNELELYYQPLVSCNQERIVGMEALIRWNHPEFGMIYPKKFIPIAEQNGLIVPIGKWVLRTACIQNKAWQDAGYPKVRVTVNISVVQLQNRRIIDTLEEIIRETGLAPEYLELEITETIAMKEKESIVETLTNIKNMGIHIAIDDFGTEYSSLNYLKHLPADRIKMDMSFIQGIDTGNHDEAIIKAVIVLARSMGINVVAEGVEQKNQNDFLFSELCDEVQGFYYYKPMPASEVEEVLKQ